MHRDEALPHRVIGELGEMLRPKCLVLTLSTSLPKSLLSRVWGRAFLSFFDLLGELLFGPKEAQPLNPTPSLHPFWQHSGLHTGRKGVAWGLAPSRELRRQADSSRLRGSPEQRYAWSSCNQSQRLIKENDLLYPQVRPRVRTGQGGLVNQHNLVGALA